MEDSLEETAVDDSGVDLIAKLDQQAAGLRNMARLITGYYKDLRRNGAPHDLASTLSLDYQNYLLSQRMGMGEGGDDSDGLIEDY